MVWHVTHQDDVRMWNMRIAHACTETAHNTIFDDEKYNCSNIGAACIDSMCIVVMALCNQPRLIASDSVTTSHVTCSQGDNYQCQNLYDCNSVVRLLNDLVTNVHHSWSL